MALIRLKLHEHFRLKLHEHSAPPHHEIRQKSVISAVLTWRAGRVNVTETTRPLSEPARVR